jgi:hypothetical protein
MMWNILFFKLKKRTVTYLDNFLIGFKANEHLENVKKVINALTNAGF